MNIKELREKFDLSQQDLADKTGIPRARIGKWELGKGKPKTEDSVILEKFFSSISSVNTDISTFKGSGHLSGIPDSYIEKRRDAKNKVPRRNEVPFFDAEAVGGLVETEMTPIHAPDGTIDVGDLLHDSQAAIRIYGNSMLPNYPPGCVVGLIKASSMFIEPGEVYVIETRDRRMLKRLFYKEDAELSEFFTCVSDNTMKFEGGARDGKLAYPKFDLPKSEIVNIFIVTGVIKRNTNSIIINR